MPGIHAFIVAFERTLQLVHDEWVTLECPAKGSTRDEFANDMLVMCEETFLRPQL